MEWIFSDFSQNFIAHGFLAVDFFFCLSGFVIAYAYDDRIKRIGRIEFFKSRLIRLHPLVIVGSILGLIAYLIDPFASDRVMSSGLMLLVLFLSSALLIPAPIMEDRAFNLFGLNAPSWSLFWEYVANIFYAFVLSRIARRWLIFFLVVAACSLSVVAYSTGNLLGGWAGSNFWDGGARVFYSFMAGVIIFRYNLIIQNKIGFPVLSVLLLLAFLMPWTDWNWITELLVVVVYFPLLVSLGAGSTLPKSLEKLCRFSGDISYPLYMTHYSVIWIFGNYFSNNHPSMNEITYIVVAGVVVLVVFAYLVMRFVDVPARKYLSRKRNSDS